MDSTFKVGQAAHFKRGDFEFVGIIQEVTPQRVRISGVELGRWEPECHVMDISTRISVPHSFLVLTPHEFAAFTHGERAAFLPHTPPK